VIDRLDVAANGLWIIVGKPGYRVARDTAGGFFCPGLAGTAQSGVEIILWLALALGFAELAIAVIVQ